MHHKKKSEKIKDDGDDKTWKLLLSFRQHGENTQCKWKDGGRGGWWQVAGGAVQCSDWSDVDSGLQISREVASTKTTQTSSFSR